MFVLLDDPNTFGFDKDWDDEPASDQGNDGNDSGDSANESGPY